MRLEKLHIIITLFAGLIVTIVNILFPAELSEFGLRLVITIVVFFIIGMLVKNYIMGLKKAMDAKNGEDDDDFITEEEKQEENTGDVI